MLIHRPTVLEEFKHLPSVTRVLQETMSQEAKAALEAWKKRVGEAEADAISKAAKEFGTGVHFQILDYILGKPSELSIHTKDIFYMDFLQFLLAETFVYSKIYGYKGIMDCVAINNYSEIVAVDWKTGSKFKRREWVEDYAIQVSAYAHAVEELFGFKIDSAKIYYFYKDECLTFSYTKQQMQEYFQTFLSKLELYNRNRNEIFK